VEKILPLGQAVGILYVGTIVNSRSAGENEKVAKDRRVGTLYPQKPRLQRIPRTKRVGGRSKRGYLKWPLALVLMTGVKPWLGGKGVGRENGKSHRYAADSSTEELYQESSI